MRLVPKQIKPAAPSPEGDAFSRRALTLGLVQCAGFAVLGTRLYQLQILERSRYAPLADDNRIEVKPILARRGQIYDRGGVLLAGNEEEFRVALRAEAESDVVNDLDFIARIVPVTPEEREAVLSKLKTRRRGATVGVIGGLSYEQVAALNVLAPQLPGVETEVSWHRRYYHGAVAGHVVGYVGRVERRAIDDDPVLRLADSKVGKSGIERGHEEALRGKGGTRRIEVDARGRTMRLLDESDPVAGQDLILSIDVPLQQRIAERLARERRAAVAVIDVGSGEVIALGSAPAYDTAELAEGLGAGAWRALAEAPDQPLLNRAAAGLYPPGSTFKMVTALAALKAGVLDPKEHMYCGGTFELAGQTYRCWKRAGHGRSDLHKALRESCDVYFYEAARRTGIKAIAAMAGELGLGQVYDCGYPQQKKGVVPDPDWKRAHFRTGWLGGETVLTGIGQGFVLVTPLQLAVMTARIAAGRKVVPTFLRPRAGERGPAFSPLDVPEAQLDLVRRAMVAVVNEASGTGAAAALLAGAPVVAGKTGTSQVSRLPAAEDSVEGAWEQRDHALFVSYFPADAPRYAVAVVVEHGGGGGAAAAPLAREVIELIVGDDPGQRADPRREGLGATGDARQAGENL